MVPAPVKDKVIKVLITGYGPFRGIANNPSWLAVKPLNGTQLELEDGRRTDIQCIQVPVHYGAVLDLVPRLHGGKPLSPHARAWYDDRCDDSGLAGQKGLSYPEGYAIEHPEAGWDVIIHVGVGLKGGIECETLAHKFGYDLPDTANELAPVIGESQSSTSVERDDGKAISSNLSVKDGKVRGFGEGYEQFSEDETTPIDVPDLVRWLNENGMGNDVKQSLDAGRYLCDFIFYCALAESKRAAQATGKPRTDCIFIHVPPVGEHLSTETCTDAIRSVALYCASKRSKA